MIPAVLTGVAPHFQGMFSQLTAFRTYLCGRKVSAYDIDAGTVLKFLFDNTYGGMLDLLSEYALVPVMYHLILDGDKVIIVQDLMYCLIGKILSSVFVFLIRFAYLVLPFVMLIALLVSIMRKSFVHSS